MRARANEQGNKYGISLVWAVRRANLARNAYHDCYRKGKNDKTKKKERRKRIEKGKEKEIEIEIENRKEKEKEKEGRERNKNMKKMEENLRREQKTFIKRISP